MNTVEDMPFSKFLVRISNSYYQTVGKFTRSILTGNKASHKEVMPPSKKQIMQKYKKQRAKGNKLHTLKKSPGKGKVVGSKKESIDMMTIPVEMSSRAMSTRRRGRLSKRSNY